MKPPRHICSIFPTCPPSFPLGGFFPSLALLLLVLLCAWSSFLGLCCLVLARCATCLICLYTVNKLISTCLLPATRVTGSNSLGGLMWNRDSPVSVVSLQHHHCSEFYFITQFILDIRFPNSKLYLSWQLQGRSLSWQCTRSWKPNHPKAFTNWFQVLSLLVQVPGFVGYFCPCLVESK